MKQRLFNCILLLVVIASLIITLFSKGAESSAPPALSGAFVPVPSSPTPHPIDAYKTEREQQHQQTVETLLPLADEPSSPLHESAKTTLLSLQKERDSIKRIEGMLLGMGYERALCVMQQADILLFTVPKAKEGDIPLILQSAADISGCKRENIRLMVP